MSNVNISLVGGQSAPVYNVIEVTRPDVVVFIYSDAKDSLQSLELIRSGMSSTLPGITEEKQEPLDATDPIRIEKRAKKLIKQFNGCQITLNISSGLKSWTHIFGIVFQPLPNARVLYMDQNNILWDYKKKKGSFDFNFNMFTQFRLYGNPIEGNYKDFESYSPKDSQVCHELRTLRRKNPKELRNLLATLTKEQQSDLKTKSNSTFYSDKGSIVVWRKPDDGSNQSVSVRLLDKYGQLLPEVILSSPHAVDLAFNSREKCHSQGIMTFSLKSDNIGDNYDSLYKMLEDELFTINAN